MTFGWQGFRVDHPDDWSPAHLSGSRKEGYARIAAPSRLSLQIRWRETTTHDLNSILDAYFAGLERECKRRKQPFSSEREGESERLTYRWVGSTQGRGAVFLQAGRLFFVEVAGGRKDALLPRLRTALDSFADDQAELQLWSVLGLSVHLPSQWSLQRHTFQAGKTSLEFEQRWSRLECVRWGFAEQLLRQYEFEAWARAALDLRRATCTKERDGLRLSYSRVGKHVEAMAAFQEEWNQFVTLKITGMRNQKPEWPWLAS